MRASSASFFAESSWMALKATATSEP
jgi:hypothetical protein